MRIENKLTLTDEQLQQELNLQSLNYHWMLRQAQNKYDDFVKPLEEELQRRERQRQ